jgi:hypothetical protein
VLVTDICNGDLADADREFILGASIVAGNKGDGGYRPIAMGEVFYKLAGLYSLELVSPHFSPIFEPLQFALSRGGSARALHILQSAIESGGPGVVALKLDFRNAFNSLKRSVILASLFTNNLLRPLYRLSHWAYKAPSTLLSSFNGTISDPILSREGVKQGDVLATLLFSNAVHEFYSSSLRGLNQIRAAACVDDINYVGHPDQVLTALNRMATNTAIGSCITF